MEELEETKAKKGFLRHNAADLSIEENPDGKCDTLSH